MFISIFVYYNSVHVDIFYLQPRIYRHSFKINDKLRFFMCSQLFVYQVENMVFSYISFT